MRARQSLPAVVLAALLASLPAPARSQPIARPSLGSCSTFPSHAEIGERLERLAADAPEVARAFVAGTSVEGRELWGLVVSRRPDVDEAEPEVRIIGAIHGDECMAAELVLEIAGWLVEGYGLDPGTTSVVDGARIVLIPLVNPDGYSRPRATRHNAHGVDLNRNLGFAWVAADEAVGPEPFSEPETRALRDLNLRHWFALGLSYHTADVYVNGPWNYTPNHPPDAALIDAIGRAYAGDSGYRVVFGWDWYTITGDVNDWSLGTRGTLDWTIELRSDRRMEWAVHEAGLRRFLEHARRGVRGVVTDSRSGEPLPARVEPFPDGAPAFTRPETGFYHRPLLPGPHTLRIVAQGHVARVVDVIVPEDGLATADVALEAVEPEEPDFAFAVEAMTLPEDLDNDRYAGREYRNRTLAWSALGAPDGRAYSMSPRGSITLDLGAGLGALDVPGPDLEIVSASGSDDPVAVEVARDRAGPWTAVGRGAGTFLVDIAGAPTPARFVRLVDEGSGPFNDGAAGYDLDAVVNHSPPPRPDIGPDADADGDVDADGDADIDADADGDSDADGELGGGDIVRREASCGCRAAGGATRPVRLELF